MKDTSKQRDTRQRRMIYDAVIERCDHPDADDIYSDIHAKDQRVSKATVYRNLKVLSENGEITQVKLPGADRFDRTLKPHYHIICTECGTVIDSPIGYNAEDDTFVEDATGYLISKHRTVFEGICPECQKKLKEH